MTMREETAKRVAYCIFTAGPISGNGVFTRAEAIARAVANTEAASQAGIEFKIFGTADKASVPDWLPVVKNEAVLVQPGPDANSQLTSELLQYEPDLLIVDSYPTNLLELLNDKKYQPPNVWGVMRHTPGALGKNGQLSSNLYGVFDRLYQIEPSNQDLTFWNDGLTRERTRCQAEKDAGVRSIYYKESPPKDTSEFDSWNSWYDRHARDSRKLIAPVVNVEPERILSRQESRATLLAHFELDPAEASSNKPLVLIALSAGSTLGDEYKRALSWMAEKLRGWGVYNLPEEQRLVVHVGMTYPKLPELWRYLPGVDYLFSSAGYNSFYEARYLAALGKFTGQAAFWPMANYPDQTWRAHEQEALFSGQYYPQGLNPVENGADYLATCIVQKLKNYVRPQKKEQQLKLPFLPTEITTSKAQ